MESFKRIVYVGKKQIGEFNLQVYVTVEFDNGRLSLTGVEGPRANGVCSGSCGQIDLSSVEAFGTGIDKNKLAEIWKEYHLNDMQAGCAHQRAEKWKERPIDASKPLDHYNGKTWNKLVWVTPDENPNGLLGVPCPTCGYKYGTAWLKKEVPESVLQWLFDLPDSSNDIPSCWRR